MPEIIYDARTHTFFCIGLIDDFDFMESLWEQWDTDFSSLELLSQHIRHSFVQYNQKGYWEESDTGLHATLISGDVINLGPARCPRCGKLMALVSRALRGRTTTESWQCRNCEYFETTSGRARR